MADEALVFTDAASSTLTLLDGVSINATSRLLVSDVDDPASESVPEPSMLLAFVMIAGGFSYWTLKTKSSHHKISENS